MLKIKKLKKPMYKSGEKLVPGAVSQWSRYGVKIVNVGNYVLYVDSVTIRKKKKK